VGKIVEPRSGGTVLTQTLEKPSAAGCGVRMARAGKPSVRRGEQTDGAGGGGDLSGDERSTWKCGEVEETAMVLRAATKEMQEDEWEAWVVRNVGKS